MEKNKKYRGLLLLAGCIVVGLIIFIVTGIGRNKQTEKIKVGFVLSGSAI